MYLGCHLCVGYWAMDLSLVHGAIAIEGKGALVGLRLKLRGFKGRPLLYGIRLAMENRDPGALDCSFSKSE